jgi:hypothetical protein
MAELDPDAWTIRSTKRAGYEVCRAKPIFAQKKIVKHIMKESRRPPVSDMLATIAGAMAWHIFGYISVPDDQIRS